MAVCGEGDTLALAFSVAVGEGFGEADSLAFPVAVGEVEGDGVTPVCPVLDVMLGVRFGVGDWFC